MTIMTVAIIIAISCVITVSVVVLISVFVVSISVATFVISTTRVLLLASF